MTWFRRLFASKARAERQLDEELRFHVEELAEANVRAGMPPEVARRRALIELGGVEKTRHAYRDACSATSRRTCATVCASSAARAFPHSRRRRRGMVAAMPRYVLSSKNRTSIFFHGHEAARLLQDAAVRFERAGEEP